MEKFISGNVIDETIYFSLQEICTICGTETTTILSLVASGVIEADMTDEQFSYRQLKRSQLALKLIQDLDVDINSLGLSLDLLEEVLELRQEVKELQRLLDYYSMQEVTTDPSSSA